jgi:hypothetical protein
MRNLILTLALALSVGVAAQADPTSGGKNILKGDYVEARTASVFAGACHYNGELTTAGREALLVWNIREGAWNGTSLNGVTAMAAVVCEENLREAKAARRSVLYIDAKADTSQVEALTAALKEKYEKSLGKVVAVRRVPITYSLKEGKYRVEAQGIGKLSVDAMPNNDCCKMPNNVWYKPLIAIKDGKVGYTRMSGVEEKSLNAKWTRAGDNTAFYGAFAL